MKSIHVIGLLLSLGLALYEDSSPVVRLTESSFQSEVMETTDFWLIEFFAPWCSHCKKLIPIYEQVATALKGVARVGALDMSINKALGAEYGVTSYPALKFFGKNRASPIDFKDSKTVDEIVKFVQENIEKRPGGASTEPSTEDDVAILTDRNFEKLVLSSTDMWIVEFYAPWCSQCKKLAPEYAKAATLLKGQVRLGKADCTVEEKLANRFEIKSYPDIKIFHPKDKGLFEKYSGGRTAEEIKSHALLKLEEFTVLPDIQQLVSRERFDSCESTTVCVIAFLPHIYDSSAAERNKYITVLQEVADSRRSKPIKFFWAQAGDLYKLEEVLGLGFGFPAVAAVTLQKERFAVMRSSFKIAEVESFVQKVVSGGVPLTTYTEIPRIPTVEEWDGKDHSPE